MSEEKNTYKLYELSKNYKQDIVGGPFGSNLKADEYVAEGQPIIRLQNVDRFNFLNKNIQFVTPLKAKELSSHSFKGGDIVVTKLGDPLGKCCIVPNTDEFKEGVISSDIVRIRIDENKVDKNYLVYHFNASSVAEQLNNNTQGSTRPRVTLQDIRNIDLFVPPLKQQKQIVAHLNALFARINKAIQLVQENLEHINHLLPAALNDVFENAEEKGWKYFTVKELSKQVQYGYTGKALDKGIYYYLRITDIQNGRVEWSKTPFSDIPTEEVDKYLLNKGDIVFARTGATSGKSYLYLDDEKSVFASYLIRVVTDASKIEPAFLYLFFQSPEYWEQVADKTIGAAQPNVNGQKLSEIVLPVPDLKTQHNIISYINNLTSKQQQLQKQYEQKLQQLKSLKASLLNAAFRGELTQQATKAKVIQLRTEILSVVAEDEAVYQTSAPLNIPQEKRAFAKQVLAGKIISLFKEDTNFTPIKFQKLQYLAEHIAQADLDWNYYYQSAGPYDNKFMHSIDIKLEKANWLTRKGKKYNELTKSTEIDNYYKTYFNPVTPKLEKLFTHFHKASESQTEIVATLYAVWNNLLIQKEEVTDDKITEKFYNWSKRKGQYTQEQLSSALKWMRDNDLVPVGFGKEIKKAKK